MCSIVTRYPKREKEKKASLARKYLLFAANLRFREYTRMIRIIREICKKSISKFKSDILCRAALGNIFCFAVYTATTHEKNMQPLFPYFSDLSAISATDISLFRNKYWNCLINLKMSCSGTANC